MVRRRPQPQDTTHLLRPEVPVLRHGVRLPLLDQPPDRNCAHEDAKRGHGSHPHVNEARRKVIAEGTQRTPALLVAAERLLEDARGAEIAAPELEHDGTVAGEGARLEQHLLRLRGRQAIGEVGGPHWHGSQKTAIASRSVIAGRGRAEDGSPGCRREARRETRDARWRGVVKNRKKKIKSRRRESISQDRKRRASSRWRLDRTDVAARGHGKMTSDGSAIGAQGPGEERETEVFCSSSIPREFRSGVRGHRMD